MKRSLATFALVTLASAGLSHAEQSNVFRSPTAGFEVTKPAAWTYLTAEQNKANLGATKLDDAEFQAQMLKYATAPLVAFTKYPEPYDDLNPSFKVNIKPIADLQGKDSTDLLRALLPQIGKKFKDFSIVQAPTHVRVSGIQSGYARFNFTVQISDGRTFPATSEIWMVPHGDYYFLLGAGTRQDEKTGSRKEIDAIVKSVKIAK